MGIFKTLMSGLMFVCLCAMINTNINATSLYKESSYESIIGDHIADKIGDSITVLIYEKASAGADSDLETHKSTDLTLGYTGANGTQRRGLNIGSGYDGGGGLSRAGNLLASITARVTKIENNGEMKIEGNQQIVLNEDTQTISLIGYVRSEDIENDNTIASTRLSNASISYLAEGTLADRQSPGWLTRIFHWIF